MITLDAWRPVSTPYSACSNTESVNRREVVVSAVGIESPASGVIGKRDWASVVHSCFRTRSGARGLRSGRRVLWWRRGGGADEDLALDLAARGQHDGIDWDWAREQGERVP